MLKVLRSITKFCNTFLGYCAGFGIFAMGLILAYEVVMRGIFKSPTIWVMDTAIYLFMWTMLIGSAYTLMLGKHVKIDLIFDRFPKKMQLVLDVITSAMAAYFCYVVTMQAWKMIQTSIKLNKLTDNMMHIPVWWIQLPLLIGFAMLAVQFVVIILERLASLFGCDCAEQK
ncbi:MAG: TRAP transporter small permease subunit [Synergistaceae bacterium]|nr:TRAP transporter small permease subunit [Synergistaceae bacterium]